MSWWKEIAEKDEEKAILINGLIDLVGEVQAREIYWIHGWKDSYINIKSYTHFKTELLDYEYEWKLPDSERIKLHDFLTSTDNEAELKAYLNASGWVIAKNGLAICLTDNYFICLNSVISEEKAIDEMSHLFGPHEIYAGDIVETFKEYAKENSVPIHLYSGEEITNIIVAGRAELEVMPWTDYLNRGFDTAIQNLQEAKN